MNMKLENDQKTKISKKKWINEFYFYSIWYASYQKNDLNIKEKN